MKVQISEIPEEGLRLQITDASWFPDQDVRRCGPVSATLFLRKQHQRIFLDGSLTTEVSLECDRCLEQYRVALESDFHIDLELVDNCLSAGEREHLCSQEEMDTEFLDESSIDISRILRQQVYLALPAKSVCTAGCRGLCSHCGANRNFRDCRCQEKQKGSPFEVLSKLKQ